MPLENIVDERDDHDDRCRRSMKRETGEPFSERGEEGSR
jgi:hypothetical protein